MVPVFRTLGWGDLCPSVVRECATEKAPACLVAASRHAPASGLSRPWRAGPDRRAAACAGKEMLSDAARHTAVISVSRSLRLSTLGVTTGAPVSAEKKGVRL